MNTRIRTSQEQNATVMAKISSQRAEIERLLNCLNSVTKDVEGSVETMRTTREIDLDEMRNDMWQMEQEVAATR